MDATLQTDKDGRAVNTCAVGIRRGLVYATPDGMALRGDLYVPEGQGPFPAVVAAPGGGWLASDPAGLRHWGEYLARHGLAVFAIQYRVSASERTFPESACDVLDAIRFVRGGARELGIDPGRIGLLGASAGAHLAALAALAPNASAFAGRPAGNAHAAVESSVRLFAGVYGVYDLFAHWQHELADFPSPGMRRSECLLGCSPFADRRRCFEASPISHVCHAGSKLPVFVAYGTADPVVDPCSQSQAFVRALRQAGHPVRECPVDGAGHFWFSEEPLDEPGSFAGFLAPHLLRFLTRHLDSPVLPGSPHQHLLEGQAQ